MVLERTLESLLDSKEIQPVHSEGDQPWDFFGRNDAKAETDDYEHVEEGCDNCQRDISRFSPSLV